MGKLLIFFALILFSERIYLQPSDPGTTISFLPDTSRFQDALITASLFTARHQTWGYDIYVNRVLLIHQPTIPCYSGPNGFATRKEALAVAELVITKIRKGQMPPTVTKTELSALGIRAED